MSGRRARASEALTLVKDNPTIATFTARGGVLADLTDDLRSGRVKMWSAWEGAGYFKLTDAGRAALKENTNG